jgi:hypothetical protein
MSKRDERTPADGTRSGRGKRAYEPPQIVTETVFETAALACGKIAGQGGQCNRRPKTS